MQHQYKNSTAQIPRNKKHRNTYVPFQNYRSDVCIKKASCRRMSFRKTGF
jgi:hypothetical protein